MSRKAIIVFVITTLFTALVVAFSWFYLSQMLRQRLLWADETASGLTRQMEYTASKAVPDLTSTRVDTAEPKALRAAITGYLQTDTNLNDMLESVVGNSQIVYDAAIVDTSGVALMNTNPALNGKPVRARPALYVLRDAGFVSLSASVAARDRSLKNGESVTVPLPFMIRQRRSNGHASAQG